MKEKARKKEFPSYCIGCSGDLPSGQHIEQAIETTEGMLCPDCAKQKGLK